MTYEDNIDSLIPAAEEEAEKKAAGLNKRYERRPGFDGQEYNHCFWSQFFHAAMKRMAAEQGYRK